MNNIPLWQLLTTKSKKKREDESSFLSLGKFQPNLSKKRVQGPHPFLQGSENTLMNLKTSQKYSFKQNHYAISNKLILQYPWVNLFAQLKDNAYWKTMTTL